MSSSDQTTHQENLSLGASAQEFLDYCAAEKERRLNSGEAFDEETFDQAIQMVINKLGVLADEGWS
ncbi:MAG: nodulation protein E [gamma proteobacterium symbiont of Ctena orbiculata]|uniref:Nodulation protein E n=1 Tax=Candidatus Thiodiazotropha taylori TaxID=2792791 RepID=A0A944QWM9_9GAMM|nr:nodulation protein E [Candidatus Thiodiazotropha taylori]PUB81281.1 MAG: nodulation protein E [gamma proteobacterium symbiont of Ctena orbiculata]MBT2991249.1 nodulation protein E [Candidatus Thiodiazotropha taylori]MBT2998953.1 nodulation protein E [Candidatus Thiodiazotropha taylori]MBT3002927.1 nodulation protein E [Candidatus Thiodiazotropha taylori]